MAAGMVTSAVAQEAINQVLSRSKGRCEEKSEAKEHMERLEMAHIKLEAVLKTSNRWHVTSAPLLRWRNKLKRAAQECDHTLRRCRQRLQEKEEIQDTVRNSSFPKQIAYAARSFVSSIFSRGSKDEVRGPAVVRRFERFADGASEFLRYVELGGTPCRHMFFDPLIRHLLACKGTKYCFVRGSQHLSFLLRPLTPPDHGMHVGLVLLLEDSHASENNFALAINLQLSESTDIIGVAVNCLQLFIPHLSSTVEIVKTKLTQLPTQDLCWVSDVYYLCGCHEYQNNLYTIISKWFRPNPLCCRQQADCSYAQSYNATRSSLESLLCDMYLEPVMQVYLLGHVALPVGNNWQKAAINGEGETSCRRDFPYLKLGMHFWPHSSSEDLSPRVGGIAMETINGEAMQHGSLSKNISCERLGNMMLPRAVDCLGGNFTATSYQMLWMSKHGSAYLRVEKTSWRLTTQKDIDGKCLERQQGKKLQGWAISNNQFMHSWIAHMPAKLQGSVMDSIQKEKRLPLPLLFKTNSCVQDCPIMLLSLQYYRSLARKIKSLSTFNG